MKKILFSVCGWGLGHATRVHALINELVKDRSINVMVASWGTALEYFKNKGFKTVEIEGFESMAPDFSFSWTAILLSNFEYVFGLNRNYNVLNNVIDSFKPDVFMIDSDPSSVLLASKKKIPNFHLTNLLTVPQLINKLPKEIINSQVRAAGMIIKRFMNEILAKSDHIFVPYLKKFQSPKNVTYTDLIVRDKPDNIDHAKISSNTYLVPLGGSWSKPLLKSLISIFKEYDNNFIIQCKGVKREQVSKRIVTVPFIKNYLSYLKTCKGVICPAGLSTLSENIIFKKPSFVIPIRNHVEQLINGMVMKDKGYGLVSYIIDEIDDEKIARSLENFFRNEEIIRGNLNKTKLKGNGAQEIAKKIMEFF